MGLHLKAVRETKQQWELVPLPSCAFLIIASISSYLLLCFGVCGLACCFWFSTEDGDLTACFKVQELILRHHNYIWYVRVHRVPDRMAFTPPLKALPGWLEPLEVGCVVSLPCSGDWSCLLQVPASECRNWCGCLKGLWAKSVPHCGELPNGFFVLGWLVTSILGSLLFLTDPLLPIVV